MSDDDFSTKNWVWIPDKDELFVRGCITDYLPNNFVRVTIKDGAQDVVKEMDQKQLENCNPPKFNKCNDMAELTHLNEPSVIYNLYLRYADDMIYTYSGLFLVAINPYKKLPIYEPATLKKFHVALDATEDRLPPHIFAIAENTYRNLVANKKDQSILVTGESGAGKTENTKKVIQYLSSILLTPENGATDDIHNKILQANPILESFGNAKTIKNNNSSRFGKFVKIFFSPLGLISGATIDYYLLEKSRVLHQLKDERNYHAFYQLLKGEDEKVLAEKYNLDLPALEYKYLSASSATIPNVDDAREFRILKEAFDTMGFSAEEVESIFKCLAIILHLGNIEFTSWKSEQANFTPESRINIIASMLGVLEDELSRNLLRPKVKAGREYVQKLQKAAEVKNTIDAFAKHLYERIFQFIILRINKSLLEADVEGENFIGVLDIAGFEIFDTNSFEQLCINFTNEKLQQFFNHHSFILEQSEYLREDIQWEFIDFGLDLQPTIDLIETKQPMGILSILDEQCILPKASEETFMNKLLDTWGNGESKKFRPNKIRKGFIIDHYAGLVEYNIDNWLQKNTDPVSESLISILLPSTNNFIADIFVCVGDTGSERQKPKLKTVSQKHKEQLSFLMQQLSSTEPHFVRCILPNLSKKPNKFDKELVLHQLRCNGVLEGIRIARAGYPNKMTFEEFFARYSILNAVDVFTKSVKTDSELILKHIKLDTDCYKIGISKLFFKNGILGKLEELRDFSLKQIMTSFQSIIRGQLARTKIRKQIAVIQASQVIARNFLRLNGLVNNNESPWLKLFLNLKPMLEDSVKVLDSNEMNESLKKLNGKLKDAETEKSILTQENLSLKERLSQLESDIIKNATIMNETTEKLHDLLKKEKHTSSNLENLTRQLAETKGVSEKLSKEKAELMSKIEDLERKLAESEDHLKTAISDYEKSKNAVVELEQKLHEANEIGKRSIEAEEKVTSLSKTHGATVKELNLAKSTIKEFESKLAAHEEVLRSLEEQKDINKRAEKNLSNLKSAATEKNTKITELESSLKQQENELAALKAEDEKLKSQLEQLEKEKKEFEEAISNLETQREDEVKELKSHESELQSQIDILKHTISGHESSITEYQKSKELHETNANQLKSEKIGMEKQLEELQGNYEKLQDEAETSKSRFEEEKKSISKMKSQETITLKADLQKAIDRSSYLESELKKKDLTSKEITKRHQDAQDRITGLNQQLEDTKRMEDLLNEQKQQNIQHLKEIQTTKDKLALKLKEYKLLSDAFENLKHESIYLTDVKAENLEQIVSLKKKVEELESKLVNKENLPPPLSRMDSKIMEEYSNLKLRLNEATAAVRKERFENHKLAEEVSMLRKKVNDSFESPLKRSELRRSLAYGEDLKFSQFADNKLAEEVKTLKSRLQLEESNVSRAENYAIELQKKLNRLQTMRGINSYSDYEAKFKESQMRVIELEKRLGNAMDGGLLDDQSSPTSDEIPRSSSFGMMSMANGSGDFAKIYRDMSGTLRSTREELNKSKTEILRLKSLLRDSEDELYELKRLNVKISVKDYESELARFKVSNETLKKRFEEVEQTSLKFRNRSEEYYEKLELAESAVLISKRHEEQSRKELENKTTELKLIKEEIRASEKVIKHLRQNKHDLEVELADLQHREQALQNKGKGLEEELQYLNDTYGEKRNAIEEHKREIRILRDDLKFKQEKETELIKENKRLAIENEELNRIRDEVLAENHQVNDENDQLTLKNDGFISEIDALRNDKQILERRVDLNTRQIEALKELIDDNRQQMEVLNSKNNQLEQRKQNLEGQVSRLEGELERANSKVELMREHTLSLESEKDENRKELQDIQQRWNSSDGNYKEARTENLVIVEENESLKTINYELKKKVEALEEKLYSNEQLNYLEHNMKKLSGDVDHLKHQLYEGDIREQKLQKQIATLEFDNQEKRTQMKRYNDENFNFQNMVGQYRGRVEFLNQENNEKDLQIKAQERQLADLREKVLVFEKDRLTRS